MSKTKKWTYLLVATALAFILSLVLGRPSMFFIIYLPMAVGLSLNLHRSSRGRTKGKSGSPPSPDS